MCMSATYFLLLPSYEAMSSPTSAASAAYAELDVDDTELSEESASDEEGEEQRPRRRPSGVRTGLLGGKLRGGDAEGASLTTADKMRLARPLVVRYMLPLFFGE